MTGIWTLLAANKGLASNGIAACHAERSRGCHKANIALVVRLPLWTSITVCARYFLTKPAETWLERRRCAGKHKMHAILVSHDGPAGTPVKSALSRRQENSQTTLHVIMQSRPIAISPLPCPASLGLAVTLLIYVLTTQTVGSCLPTRLNKLPPPAP